MGKFRGLNVVGSLIFVGELLSSLANRGQTSFRGNFSPLWANLQFSGRIFGQLFGESHDQTTRPHETSGHAFPLVERTLSASTNFVIHENSECPQFQSVFHILSLRVFHDGCVSATKILILKDSSDSSNCYRIAFIRLNKNAQIKGHIPIATLATNLQIAVSVS